MRVGGAVLEFIPESMVPPTHPGLGSTDTDEIYDRIPHMFLRFLCATVWEEKMSWHIFGWFYFHGKYRENILQNFQNLNFFATKQSFF